MDFLLVRDERRRAFLPATDIDYDRIGRIPFGYPVSMRGTMHRTGKLQKWYRGLVGGAANGLDRQPESMHNELKLKKGLVEQVFMFGSIQGGVAIKLRSTAYPEMGDLEFSDYCDFVVPCLFRDYIPGIKSSDQRKLVMEWAGRRPKLEEPPKLILPG